MSHPSPDIPNLRRLHAAATPGEWESTTYSNYAGWSVWAPNGAGCIAERWYPVGTQDQIPRNDLFISALHNAFPVLADRIEELEERVAGFEDERKGVEDQRDAAIYFMHLNGHEISGKDVPGAWLAARDARMRREGAAEWLDDNVSADWLDVDQRDRFRAEAARLRSE